MSARSTQVNIVNGTSYVMVLKDDGVDHGVWNGGPVNGFGANTMRCVAENDSDGFMTGDQGWITYSVLDGQTNIGSINVNWNNPYVGNNSYSCSTSVPYGYIGTVGGGGDNASVTFVFCIAKPYASKP